MNIKDTARKDTARQDQEETGRTRGAPPKKGP